MSDGVRILGLEAALVSLRAALDEELPRGMLEAARVVADYAAGNHPYTNRTGQLQANTQAGNVTGEGTGELIAEVLGDTPYGSFVEERDGFAFLEPAVSRTESEIVRAVEDALDRAVSRSGWV